VEGKLTKSRGEGDPKVEAGQATKEHPLGREM